MANENSNLREKLGQIQDALKDIPGVHLQDIRGFIDGNLSVNKKGILRLPLALPAEDILQTPDDVGAVVRGEWKMVPLLMFVEADQ